jgi:hypothetical protein
MGMSPYHATAADRIEATEAGLGRKIWAARDLPDDLARALWWKRRRWLFEALLDGMGHDSDRPGYHTAIDERDEAESAHELLIREMWVRRFAAREDRKWRDLANRLPASTDRAVEGFRAMGAVS